MEKIKDLKETILTPDTILGELIKPKRFILTPDGTKDEDSYIKVVTVGVNVKDIFPEDIIIKVGGQMTGYPMKNVKGEDVTMVFVSRGAVLAAVRPDNFINPDKITDKVNV
jgi:hypothetical protein